MTPESLRTLYICYFGLREPLVQTQVLPYLREIIKGEIKVFLLTFEPKPKQNWTRDEIEAQRKSLADEGIEWHFLTYHKWPSAPATFYDVLHGAFFTWRMIGKKQIGVLHARSHVPLAMALPAKSITKCKLIFDIRGLMAEEYIDSGVWREGSLRVRIVKWIERLGLKHADQIVVLTKRLRQFLIDSGQRDAESIEVVPCCVDFARISTDQSAKSKRFELVYAGSVTGLYMLREMGEFFLALKHYRPGAFFRILTSAVPKDIHKLLSDLNFEKSDYCVESVAPEYVLNVIRKSHLAISFRKPTFSQIAASPTKIPEYLAVGLPVVSSEKIGDMDALIEGNNVGIIVRKFDSESLDAAAINILKLLEDRTLAHRCAETARDEFDLGRTGKSNYLKAYEFVTKVQTGISAED